MTYFRYNSTDEQQCSRDLHFEKTYLQKIYFNPIQQIKQFLYPYEKAFRQRRPPEKNWELKSQTLTENRKRKSDYPAPEQLVGCSAALGAVAGGNTWHTSRWDTVMSFSAAIEAKKQKKTTTSFNEEMLSGAGKTAATQSPAFSSRLLLFKGHWLAWSSFDSENDSDGRFLRWFCKSSDLVAGKADLNHFWW